MTCRGPSECMYHPSCIFLSSALVYRDCSAVSLMHFRIHCNKKLSIPLIRFRLYDLFAFPIASGARYCMGKGCLVGAQIRFVYSTGAVGIPKYHVTNVRVMVYHAQCTMHEEEGCFPERQNSGRQNAIYAAVTPKLNLRNDFAHE